MPLYRVAEEKLAQVPETTFASERLLERRDLQRMIQNDITVLSPDLMVICDEYGDWEDSNRRIDLLCVDKEAHLVVIEIKRTEDGGHMELQAVRYAAMVSSMTVDQLVAAHARYIGGEDAHPKAESAILAFLDWETTTDETLAEDVRIILVAANFSLELTTAVLWLNKSGLDLRCIRILPYRLDESVLIDVQQIIPLPEAADYETKIRSQQQEQRRAQSARTQIFRRFWAQLIERSRPFTSLFANRTASSQHWLVGRIGRRGFEFNLALSKESSRVECMIDFGPGAETKNLETLLALKSQREKIEQAFGEELDWQELDDSRACRICKTLTGGWKTPETEWPDLQDRLVRTMARFEDALKQTVLGLRVSE